ncbi:MAG: sialate O-acetylesterase [Treponema sp.]|jgi:lysophospholipase L1-like esterase|nr:sialate O-acetylesterase [Treponema sp.]
MSYGFFKKISFGYGPWRQWLNLAAVCVAAGLGCGVLLYTGCQGTAPINGKNDTPSRAKPQDGNKDDFHVYLCFGQSNMEGYSGAYQNPKIEEEDLHYVDPRFQMLAAVDFPNHGRVKKQWYTAYPPLCRSSTGLCPADYFGRILVSSLPQNIQVGIINVSVAGSAIEIFDQNRYQSYIAGAADWLKDIANNYYGGNPYEHLVDLARTAQTKGVIKGILLHQGESNGNADEWLSLVNGIYDRLLSDLGLEPDSIPLLAGELVNGNTKNMINRLPEVIPRAHVIASSGCGVQPDNLHFNPAGYRELGKRYAGKMLAIMGIVPAE